MGADFAQNKIKSIQMDKPLLLEQRIIECLSTQYGIDIVTLSFLPVGADMKASVYKAIAKDKSYFVKIKQGFHHNLSVAITKLLHDAGIDEVISPINTISGEITQNMDRFTVIVYPFIEGKDGFNRTFAKHHWLALGKALKKVHTWDVPLTIENQIRRETYAPKWREGVRSYYRLENAPQIDDDISRKLLQFMKENQDVILRLVDNADKFSQSASRPSPEFVFCHADIHAGNVLVGNNDQLYIVDWDEPMMAPHERDLMFFGAGVGNVWNKPEEVEIFFQGYGKTDIDKEMLAYYRHERIVEDIAEYTQELLFTSNGGDRALMYKHFLDMFEPNGVVEIAFKTHSIKDKLN